MANCGNCRFGKLLHDGQVSCTNVESDFCGELKDIDDSCKYNRQASAKPKKENTVEEKYIGTMKNEKTWSIKKSETEKRKVTVKPEAENLKPTKEKSYRIKPNLNEKGHEIFVINYDGRRWSANDNGKYNYFVSEHLAQEYCKVQNSHMKKGKLKLFGYVRAFISLTEG